MNRIGLSLCGKPMTETAFREIKAAGIDAVEVCAGTPYRELDFAALRKTADAAGIELWSLHNQLFSDAWMSAPDTASNRRWIEGNKEVVNRAADAGIPIIVIHPCDTEDLYTPEARYECMQRSKTCINELVEHAAQKGCRIAVENLPRTALCNCPEEHLDLLSCNDKLCACFDFNHSLLGPTTDFLEKIAHRLVTVHVSDRDDINERHWMPGEGVLCWPEIMAKFAAIGYTGVWMYEIEYSAPPTIDRRLLTPADFVENARTLFAGKTPAPIGTPKQNLGLWGPKE